MTMTQRGQLSQADKARMLEAYALATEAEVEFRRIASEMVDKSSYREVARLTGLSTNTLQRWKREAGK